MTDTAEILSDRRHLPDDVTIRHWLGFFAFFLAAAGIPLILLVSAQPWTWAQWAAQLADLSWPQRAQQIVTDFAGAAPAVKLLTFAIYVSLCSTFLPLPTGWIVAGVATREAAVCGDSLWATVLVVASVGAAASTIANLNDYHLFTWLLRHHRIAKVRHTHTHQAAERWFARAPFFLLVVFNIVPIPVDVIRMLATSYRYPRVPFAAANFLGRFGRYGIIAFVTYWWNLGWIAVAALLGLAAVLGLARLATFLARRILSARANRRPI